MGKVTTWMVHHDLEDRVWLNFLLFYLTTRNGADDLIRIVRTHMPKRIVCGMSA